MSPHTITTHDALRRELTRTRVRGFAVNQGGWRTEVGGVAAPIFGVDGIAFAAVCVAAPRFRMTRDWLRRVPPAVVRAAQQITTALAPAPSQLQLRLRRGGAERA
jgi:DNA-binding IclR family transcriptional regulator